MADKDFEIVVRYGSWNVEIYDSNLNLLSKLNCKSNNWFSSYRSGTSSMNGNIYSVLNNKEGISLTLNDSTIGHVAIGKDDWFGRFANIEIESEKFCLRRKDLKQIFVVTNQSNNILLSIEGKLYKDKQKNLFGLLYFPNEFYHSVFLSDLLIDKRILIYLLTVCGYCARAFLEIDAEEYTGKVLSETNP